MNKAKNFISTLLYHKFFWQLILAAFMIGMAAFFIRNEHLEFIQMRHQLTQSKFWYVCLGILLTILYIIFQGQMYVHSFKALGKNVRLRVAIKLFLKRNMVSIFLPAGGFSSLAFFTKDVEDEGISRSKIHLASTIFGLFSILSVVVIAFPIIGFALLNHNLQQTQIVGFVLLILLTIGFILFLYSVSKKGKAYHWLSTIQPSITVILDEMVSHDIDRKQLWLTLLVSIGIEFIGIIHLYIAMLAQGFEPSWPAAIIGYIVMVILLIVSPFLRGLGAIEVSLTYLLGQYGFSIVAAAAITIVYRFFEFWLPLFIGIGVFFTRKDNLVLRILPAIIIFILGVVNILSAITPAIPMRLRLMRDLLPENFIETSNALVLVFGLLLVILSVFLLQGSKRAWYMGLFLTGFSVLGHLVKAADYEEAMLAFVAATSLLYTRNSYKLKPHPKLTKVSYFVLIYSVLALLAYGIISFYFIDKKHFGVDFKLLSAIKIIFRLFFLFDDSGLTPLTAFGQHFLYSIYISGGLVLSFIFFSLMKPHFSEPYNSKNDLVVAKDILQRYGKSALDYFKTYPDKLFFISEDQDAFISFKVTRHFAFVLENPVCKDDEAFESIVRSFDRFCNENGFICVYYRVPQASLPMYKKLGKKSMPIGEEAILNLTTFSLDGGKMKTTRSAISRLTAEGYDVKIYQPPIKEGLLQKLELVSDKWLNELDQKEVAFTQGVFDKTILKEQAIITVEDKEEKVYAFLNIVPDYAPGDATYDMIRKVKEAPNGVLDMLLAKTLLYLKEQNHQSVNMGLAPLSGIEGINLAEKTIRYAYENLKAFGHFKGLRKYKDKFFPQWEKKYLIYSHDYHLLQVPNALKRVSEGN